MRAFTDEQLEALLQAERVKVVTEIEKELDQWVSIVRRTDVHMIERLRDRIVGLLVALEKPTSQEQNDGRKQARWESPEWPEHERRVSEPDGQGALDEGVERATQQPEGSASTEGHADSGREQRGQGEVKKIDCGDTRPEELTG